MFLAVDLKNMKKQLIFWCIGLTILLFGQQPGYAQDDESESVFATFKDTFDGYLKNATAARLDELDRFVKIENSVELKYSNWLTDHIGVTLTGLAVYDAVYDVEDDLEVEDEEDYRAYVDLREGFLDLTFGKIDLRIGKQQVVWGSTDGFRVTDVVNPLDLREFGLAEFLDARIPLWMGKIDYYLTTDFSLQALIIPEMQFVEPAHAGSEYAFGPPEIPQGFLPIINAVEEPDVLVGEIEALGVEAHGIGQRRQIAHHRVVAEEDVDASLDSERCSHHVRRVSEQQVVLDQHTLRLVIRLPVLAAQHEVAPRRPLPVEKHIASEGDLEAAEVGVVGAVAVLDHDER